MDGTLTSPYSFTNWLKETAKKAGIEPTELHALRHSYVASLVEQNIQPLSIQGRLGHVNTQITLGTYGHLYAKSDQQVVNAIDNVQGGAILLKNDNLLPVRVFHGSTIRQINTFAPAFSVELFLSKMYRK